MTIEIDFTDLAWVKFDHFCYAAIFLKELLGAIHQLVNKNWCYENENEYT